MSGIIPATKEEKVLHRDLQVALDRLPIIEAQIRGMQKSMEIAADLESRFPQYSRTDTNCFGSGEVHVHFQFSSVHEAAEVLRYLASEKGLRQTREPWNYEHDKSKNWHVPGLMIVGHFMDEGGRCRYVQTGVKETPVYELRCEDAPEVSVQQ